MYVYYTSITCKIVEINFFFTYELSHDVHVFSALIANVNVDIILQCSAGMYGQDCVKNCSLTLQNDTIPPTQ